MSVSFTCRGHPNIAATHAKTVEFTRDPDISRRATCVLGVASDHDDAALRTLRGHVEVTIACGGHVESLTALVSPFFLGDDSLVLRTGEGLRGRTFAYDASKGSSDLDRDLVAAAQSPGATLHVTVRATGRRTAPGALFVVALPIGNDRDVTRRAIDVLTGVDLVLAEDTRRLHALAQRLGIATPPARSYYDENEAGRAAQALEMLESGARLALVSDAGTPLTSDPGYVLVSQAADRGMPVVPVPGASASLAVLMASGLPVDRYVFAGFLPRRSPARRAALRELARAGLALVCYEAPTRIASFLADVAAVGPGWRVCVGREMTKVFEEFRYGTAADLAAELADDERPLGEFTIVIAPDAAAAEDTGDDALLRALLAQGVAPSTLARALKQARGLSRNAAYEHVLGLEP